MKKRLFLYFLCFVTLCLEMSSSVQASDVVYDRPDYTVNLLPPKPEKQIQGNKITFTAEVKNIGLGPTLRLSRLEWSICETACGLESNWTVKETDSVNGLAIGAQEIETFSWAVNYGDTRVRAICDAGKLIDEINENNNSAETSVTTDKPDLVLLEDSIRWTPANPMEGQEVTIYAKIYNQGKGGTTTDFEVNFKIINAVTLVDVLDMGTVKVKDDIQFGSSDSPILVYEVQSKGTWTAAPGRYKIRIDADSTSKVTETDEENNFREKPLSDILYPDLVISDDSAVWWSPEVPKDGQEVTFYARIDNIGDGGTRKDFKVQFIVDQDATGKTDLGTSDVKDDVLPGNRKPIMRNGDGNGGFETNDLTHWTINSGSVSINTFCDQIDTMCPSRIGSQYYAWLYGYNTSIKSESFLLASDLLAFRAQASGTGNKYLKICRKDSLCDGSNGITVTVANERTYWPMYIVDDFGQLAGKEVYVQLITEKATVATMYIDDIRLYKTDVSDSKGRVSVVAKSSKTWVSKPGEHTISVVVDVENTVSESPDESASKQKIVKTIGTIQKADYMIVDMQRTPLVQLQGNPLTYSIVIRNVGSDTYVASNLNWYVAREGVSQYPTKAEKTESITGLLQNQQVEKVFKVAASYGTTRVKAILNDDGLLQESDWIEWSKKPGTNNSREDFVELWPVDLEVKDVWWKPENPTDGQNVIFYARVDNVGEGGAMTDFNVQFIVDQGKATQNDLGETTVSDDIIFGKRMLAVTNGDFEGDCYPDTTDTKNKLCGWNIVSGGLTAVSYCAPDDVQCLCRLGKVDDNNPNCTNTNTYGNQYYARLFGTNTIVQSKHFLLEGEILQFKAKTVGSGNKRVILRRLESNAPASTDPILTELLVESKSFWTGYVMDISSSLFIGRRAYIELRTEGSTNAELLIDDFRLTRGRDEMVIGIVQTKKTWASLPGLHSITVKADSQSVISEYNKDNNAKTLYMGNIGKADYKVESLTFAPPEQIKGKTFTLTSVIRNLGSATSTQSGLIWYECRPDERDCGNEADWKKIWAKRQTENVTGLASGGSYTVYYVAPVYYGVTKYRVECNADSLVDELYTNNNWSEIFNDVKIPDLTIKDVWWVPQSPKDGESVTFYASVLNKGEGGTLEEFDVDFKVVKMFDGTIEQLGTGTVKDETPYGQRYPIFNQINSALAEEGKEGDSLPGWNIVSGGVSVESRCVGDLVQCKEKSGDAYYVHMYGKNTILQSPSFNLNDYGADTIQFFGYTKGSGTKTVMIRELTGLTVSTSDPALLTQTYTEQSPWRANIIDISKIRNKKVYLELKTTESTNAEFFFDDFRMSKDKDQKSFVTIPLPKKTWIAKPGDYTVTVEVDIKGKILESDETNQVLSKKVVDANGNTVGQADYQAFLLPYTPQEQVAGREVAFTGIVKNIGKATDVVSEMQWQVKTETTAAWKVSRKDTVVGLAEGASYTSSFTLKVEYGETIVRLLADSAGTISETNENNNQNERIIATAKPQIVVGDVWWTPISPKEGEQVTFFARTDNIGQGGTTDEYEISFLLKEGENTALELERVKVKEEVPFALRKPLFSNASFEGDGSGDVAKHLANWQVVSGTVFIESRCAETDTQCKSSIGDMYYANLSGANTILRSPSFDIMQSASILFRGQGTGSGTTSLYLIEAQARATNQVLKTVEYTEKSAWHGYVVDVSDFIGKRAYIELRTDTLANQVGFMVDDFRMIPADSASGYTTMVTIASPKKTWVAKSGNFYITAQVIMSGEQAETGITKLITNVPKADYEVITLTYTPQEQVKGRDIEFTAVLKNNGAPTLVESDFLWFACRPGEKDCGNTDKWTKVWDTKKTVKVPALATGGTFTTTYLLPVDYEETRIRAASDIANLVQETKEDNNVLETAVVISHIDLKVGDIWWSPPSPKDGETVTFYAQIENTGEGGTIEDFDIEFIVDSGTVNEKSLGSDNIKDNTLMGKRKLIQWNTCLNYNSSNKYVGNAGFEVGDLSCWTSSGSVFIESRETETTVGGKDPVHVLANKYYARLYGEAVLKSPAFTLTGKIITLLAQTSGGGDKILLIRKANAPNKDSVLISKSDFGKTPWQATVIDISAYSNENVYMEIQTTGATNATFLVDEFRMLRESSDENDVVVGIASKGKWVVSPGTHTIRANVDSRLKIVEMSETNNLMTKTVASAPKVDYVVEAISYTPVEPIQGREMTFKAQIKNQNMADTIVKSNARWSICQGEIAYCDREKKWEQKDTIQMEGLAANTSFTTPSYILKLVYDAKAANAVPESIGYTYSVMMQCDADSTIDEGNEANTAEQNNTKQQAFFVYHPDLKVKSIWWSPTNPLDGESVTYYARIDNVGKGGTLTPFEVQFIIDESDKDIVKDLGVVKLKEEVQPAKRALIPYGGFEDGLSGWTTKTGTVFLERRCAVDDALCNDRMSDNLYYAHLYGINSILRSQTFELDGDSITFTGQTNGAGTKNVRVCKADTECTAGTTDELITSSYSDKTPWRAYVIDISKYQREKVYLEINTNGSANGEFMVDNIRMKSDDTAATLVAVVEAKSKWTATPDKILGIPHSITVIVDPKNEVSEVDESIYSNKKTVDRNSVAAEKFPNITKADYKLTMLRRTPLEQLQGRNVAFTAVIKNIGSTTMISTDLKWYTCQGNSDTCTTTVGYEQAWKQQRADIVPAISESGEYSLTYSLYIDPLKTTNLTDGDKVDYTIWVKAVADDNAVINESNENNNSDAQVMTIAHPDLVVNDIWWLPKVPIDGQEVTFYAQIENKGWGGTTQSFEVEFTIEKGKTTQEDLGTTKIQDETVPARRIPLFSDYVLIENGGFEAESEPLTQWYAERNVVWSKYQDSGFLPYRAADNQNYAVLTGEGAILQSKEFEVIAKPYLTFIAQTEGAGEKLLKICQAGTDCQTQGILISKSYKGAVAWQEYAINVSSIKGKLVYLKLMTQNIDDKFRVDDFRLATIGGFEDYPIMSVSTYGPLTTWTRYSGDVHFELWQPETSMPADKDIVRDKNYVLLYGQDAELLSPVFLIKGDSIIFKGQTKGTGTGKVLIRKQLGISPNDTDDPILIEESYTDKTPWHAYFIDVSRYQAEPVYLHLKNDGSANFMFMVDDFRMTPATDPYGSNVIAIVSNSKTWYARSETSITVAADPKNEIFEYAGYYSIIMPVEVINRSRAISKFIRPGEDNNSLTLMVNVPRPIQIGDIDGNDIVDLSDAILGLKILLGESKNNNKSTLLIGSDFDKDGYIGIEDIILIFDRLQK